MDGHEGYRAGLARAIADHPLLELVGEAADGREALEQALRLAPDLLVLEVRLAAARVASTSAARWPGSTNRSRRGPCCSAGGPNESLSATAAQAGVVAVLDKSAARLEICDRLAELGG